jgi:hypothetical protein
MRTSFIFYTALFALGACGPKDAPVESLAGSAPADARGPEVPSDAASKAFARKFLALQIKDWSPTDPGGVNFRYMSLAHKSNNTWQAEARIGSDEEEMDCRENGTWSMEPAIDEGTATVIWTLAETSCPGRETGKEMRGRMEIRSDGTFRVAIH